MGLRWPLQIPALLASQTPPCRTSRLWGIGYDGDARGGLLEAVAAALELEHGGAVHEAVEDGGGHGGVAEVRGGSAKLYTAISG